MSKYRPQVDLQSDESRRIVSDYVKELSIDYYLSAVIPPDESIEIKLQVYDFSINRWLTVSINNLSFYEKNIGSNIGYIKDYLNSELNMFTRLEINAGKKSSVDIKVNYLDLMFYYYERGIYTIKPYKALVENYVDMSRETHVEAFKIASITNGDIISKSGFQPIRYLKLTATYSTKPTTLTLTGSTPSNYSYSSTDISKPLSDSPNIIERELVYNDIKTDLQYIIIDSNQPLTNVQLSYSYYGDSWVVLKEIGNLPEGTTTISNNLIDLYGLQIVDYSNINPMSKVSLRSIWNVKLGELNSQEGSLSNMSNDYFNAVWQDIDKLSDIDLGSMKVIKDIEGGVFDGATGEVIKATLFDVGVYTDLDMLSYTLNNYTEPLTLGSSRLISELKEELLTAESINVDNRVKVIYTDTEITINE